MKSSVATVDTFVAPFLVFCNAIFTCGGQRSSSLSQSALDFKKLSLDPEL